MKKLLLVIGFVLLCLVSLTEAGAKQRTSKNVRQQQKLTEQKIKQTDAQIKENARVMKSKLNDLNKLQAESQTINRNIVSLQASIDSLETVAQAARDSVAVLDRRLTDLRDSYADILRNSRHSRMAMNNLAFIFSSESFTQAFRRANALKQFTRWRERKVNQIKSVKARLDERLRYVDTLTTQNRELAMRMSMRHAELRQRASETDKIVSSLKGKEADLRKLLREQQRQATALDRELDKIIKEEQRKALLEEQKRKKQEEERRKAEERRRAEEKRKADERQDDKGKAAGPSDSNASKTRPAPAEKPGEKPAAEAKRPAPSPALSTNFAANKGRLSYPVNPHNIVRRFGRQQHPLHKNVMTDNAGIDMETSSGAAVKCVFDGEVSAIFCPDGYNNVVLVRHGQYLTVYANLGTLSVRTGDKVKTGQTLGTVYVDAGDNGRSILHFEIRNAVNAKSVTKENPEVWLR
ncbi:MAG: peptidoglycan DD-metalloendopeptidase family protein [Muribaculaceae bacterium]|nr:peptidoglycan DD-metalloendopeptidase family protein [Muribaculaceae bacterium]